LGVEGGFETAHENHVRASDGRTRRRKMPTGNRRSKIRAPNIDMAFELSRAPRESGGGVFRGAKRENGGSHFGKAIERGGGVCRRKKSKVEDAAGPGEDGVGKRSLAGERMQLPEKRGETSGKSRDLENGGVGRSFEKERNRLTDVVPEVGAFGFVENDELCVLCLGRCGETIQFAGGALADFRSAFDTDTKMPGIREEFSLKRGGGRFGGIFFGFEEKLHELRAEEIDRSWAKRRAFDEVVESESVFVGVKRDDEAAARWRRRKSAEVESRDNRERAERADEEFVEVIAGDIFNDAAAAFAEAARAVHKFRADEEVARGAVRMAKRGVDAGGNDPADGGFEIKRDGEREKLLLLVEGSGEVVEIGAGIGADGEIARIVMGDLVKAGHVEGDVVTRRRHADLEFGAMAAGDKGESFEGGEADDFGDLFGGGGFGDDGRNDFINGVLRADCWIGSDVRSADGGFEAGSEIWREVRHEEKIQELTQRTQRTQRSQRGGRVRHRGKSCVARTR